MVSKQPFLTFAALASLATAAVLAGCGGSSSSKPTTSTTGNTQAIAVDGGPVPGQLYPDAAFTSVTVCVPGSSSACQTVGGILVDTGSYGLRLLASAIPSLNLPTLTGTGGLPLYNCVSFVDGSFLWGPLAQADVKIAGELASKASIQLAEDPTGFPVPVQCSNGGVDENSLAALGANGILGVGPEAQDCGSACDPSAGGTPPNVYFTCSQAGACSSAFVSVSQQITNPVVLFPRDNNGVLIQMQPLNGAAATASGSMIFGIGTQSNNQLGTATVLTMNSADDFTTTLNQQTLNQSFIDSGSNGFFFPDSAIPQCAANSIAPGFYCPTSTLNLSAQNTGANNANSTVNFSVDNAATLFQTDASDAAFSNLAGSSGSGTCSPQNPGACSFDWGLPFFFGRSVWTAIRGQTVPSGTPAAPWWAY